MSIYIREDDFLVLPVFLFSLTCDKEKRELCDSGKVIL